MDAAKTRIGWVDYAKGICIILVVMMHSTLGVEKAAGGASILGQFVEWAKPFRMPDFFLISGLFLATRIDRPWREYLDGKVVHFAYFYILWMTIQFAFKGYGIWQDTGVIGVAQGWLMGFIEPFGTLWFIYLLAVFFVVVKLTRQLPPLVVFAAGAALEALPIETHWLLIDEFASRFVYFFAGYWLAKKVFAFAAGVDKKSWPAIAAGLAIWAMVNTFFVVQDWHGLPGISLALGLIGACAVVSAGVLLSKFHTASAIRYCGKNSIVIYLAFFLPMAVTRTILLKTPLAENLSATSAIVTAAGVIAPLILFWLVRNTRLAFLFRRPRWAKLESSGAGWHSAAHVKAQSQAR
jgi:uncharacterized membrane protein YcfT